MAEEDFLSCRQCLRAPIAAIFHAAHLLDRAVGAHLAGRSDLAAALIREADLPEVGTWVDSLWGRASAHPEQPNYLRPRNVPNAPPTVPKEKRVPARMPDESEKAALIDHWGHHCAFCSIPVIRSEVRDRIRKVYPEALRWGASNASQHAAFQCLWLQYDHVLPHARGGGNDIENVIVTCAGCNFGRGSNVLEEQGLLDPRDRPPIKTSWDGLERFRQASAEVVA